MIFIWITLFIAVFFIHAGIRAADFGISDSYVSDLNVVSIGGYLTCSSEETLSLASSEGDLSCRLYFNVSVDRRMISMSPPIDALSCVFRNSSSALGIYGCRSPKTLKLGGASFSHCGYKLRPAVKIFESESPRPCVVDETAPSCNMIASDLSADCGSAHSTPYSRVVKESSLGSSKLVARIRRYTASGHNTANVVQFASYSDISKGNLSCMSVQGQGYYLCSNQTSRNPVKVDTLGQSFAAEVKSLIDRPTESAVNASSTNKKRTFSFQERRGQLFLRNHARLKFVLND